jgi:membrane protein
VDLLAPLKAFDRAQQRRPALAFPMAVVKKFGDDQGGNLVTLIAYRAFFSIFPLLLVFTTVLGFVLSGHPDAQRSVLNSALSQFPVIGEDLKANALSGSALGLAIGLATSIWAGLGITLAAQTAMDRVWAVPMRDRPDFLQARLRGLALLVGLGLLNIASTVASGLVAAGLGNGALKILGYGIALGFNLALFFAAFRLLTDDEVPTRDLWPGIVLAAVAWEVLQIIGGYYVGHAVRSAGPTYGTFALVIGLLAWIHLGATVVVLSAEVNAVRVRGLWPRSLLGAARRPEDEETLTALAKIEEREDHQHVTVSYDEAEGDG